MGAVLVSKNQVTEAAVRKILSHTSSEKLGCQPCPANQSYRERTDENQDANQSSRAGKRPSGTRRVGFSHLTSVLYISLENRKLEN